MDDYPTLYALRAGPKAWCIFKGKAVVFTDSPFKATLFQTEHHARARSEKVHTEIVGGIPSPVGAGEFSIYEITILQYEEDDVS